MNVVPKLEASLIWDAAGHLAEVAVAVLADGELALLPRDAVQHAGSCPVCTERVGQAALFAFEVVEAIGLEAEALALVPRLEPTAPARGRGGTGGHGLRRSRLRRCRPRRCPCRH